MRRMILTLVVCAAGLWSQEGSGRMTIAFRDPTRPGMVKVSTLNGAITVKAYEGKEVVLEADRRDTNERETEATKGLKRLRAGASNITMEEENNVVSVNLGMRAGGNNVSLLVPAKTSLKLSTTNGKAITVEGVDGEMELTATNGNIQLNDVSGSVVAHSMNGKIVAKFRRIDGDKPMSFSSYNGTVDVTLPAATKANLKLQTYNGEVFTDFDVALKPNSTKVDKVEVKGEQGRTRNRISMESSTLGTINGGGPEYTFKNFNGSVYIRKGN